VPAVRVNQRTVLVQTEGLDRKEGVGLCARVSSHDQKSGLERQVARLTDWATTTGTPIVRVESEVGSAMNGNVARPDGCSQTPTSPPLLLSTATGWDG
jgi:putative resolvase